MAASTPLIGVILCSGRKPRFNPQAGNFVTEIIDQFKASTPGAAATELKIIDLAEWNLPMYNENIVPVTVTNTSQYQYEYTRAWSEEVKKYSGFIFILPQYNWGYPSIVKNALDYLFFEWKNKAATIISYGGHGGGKSSAQLQEVLKCLSFRVTKTLPQLTFPSQQVMGEAASGKELTLLGPEGIWESERENVTNAYKELTEIIATKVPESDPAK